MKSKLYIASLATIAILVAMSVNLNAENVRVLPVNQLPNDRRLGALKELSGDYFPFVVPKSRQQWKQWKDNLKRRILVATGLWPMPDKTPLKPVIHGRVERDDFTVDKVYLESYPDHFVTGLLFKPKHISGRLPGVLCPHGHGGRFQDYGEKGIREQIVRGAERFEQSGRYPKLARCAQLARMGCITFIFDMVGYADSVQISRQVAHSFSKQRPDFDTKENWGFFATQAELRLQSIMGLQTWNSIRALDFLCGLPEVDSKRIGVTGGSGGGTQTILLCAIDPRPVVGFPNGMVSTDMQGGCTCENCSLLRIGTGNVELAALFAPKPQGMTAANDWTKEMMTKGYPELKQLYAMLGTQKNVICHPLTHFPHNYNYVSRALMYSWFNKHLALDLEEPVVEEDWPPLTQEEWSVWNDEHPKPADDPGHERKMLRYVSRESDRKIAALTPTDAQSLARFRKNVGGAFETIIGRTLNQVGPIDFRKIEQLDRDGYLYHKGLLGTRRHGEEIPVISFLPERNLPNKQVVLWIDGQGKSALVDRQGRIIPEIRQLLDAGMAVLSADLLYQGEFLSDGKPLTQARSSTNPRAYAGFTFGYNHPLFAQRVHDILTLVSFARSDKYRAKRIHLVGVNGAGPWVAAARAITGDDVDSAAIDTGGFRFANLASYRDVNFLPGAVKYGDLPGLLALSAPERLWICGETEESLSIVTSTYAASGKLSHLTIDKKRKQDSAMRIVQWLKQMKGRL
ncbi:MAG: acetylxylan esterase [Planctomycetes bacterium]|nr:acetylxylan esterase [Planctomycetota bacterium]